MHQEGFTVKSWAGINLAAVNPARGAVSWSRSLTAAHGDTLSLSENRWLTQQLGRKKWSDSVAPAALRCAAFEEVVRGRMCFCFACTCHRDRAPFSSWVDLTQHRCRSTCGQPWSSTSAYNRTLLGATVRTKCGNGERSVPVSFFFVLLVKYLLAAPGSVWVTAADVQRASQQGANSNIKLVCDVRTVFKKLSLGSFELRKWLCEDVCRVGLIWFPEAELM